MLKPALLLAAMGLGGLMMSRMPTGGPSPSSPPRPAQAPPRVAPECPPEELSCGLQKPVIANGAHRFENETYGLRMSFPRGSEVCLTRSGDYPHGFFAVYARRAGCLERPQRMPPFVSVYAEFNALLETSLLRAARGCDPLSAALRRRVGPAPLAFPHYRSIACRQPSRPGTIEIVVHALAGPWERNDPELPRRTRAILFAATLGTTPARLAPDLARFRRILGSIEIRSRD